MNRFMSYFHKAASPIIDKADDSIVFKFQPASTVATYDVCSPQGKILKSSKISENSTTIDLSDFDSHQFVLVVLDGNRIYLANID